MIYDEMTGFRPDRKGTTMATPAAHSNVGQNAVVTRRRGLR